MEKLILVGGGGHCKACIDVIELQKKYEILGILDTADKVGETLSGYPIIDTDDAMAQYVAQGCYFLVTVGQIESSNLRQRLYGKLEDLNASIATVISPRAYIARTAKIDKGVIVMHDALVNAGAHISNNCIINTKSLIEHDAYVRAHCHISTGAIVNGGAKISSGTFVGSNSVVVHGVSTKTEDFVKAGSCYASPRIPIVTMKTAVLTTIFPINQGYVRDYFQSLCRQTVQGFDVILINDGYGDISRLRSQYPSLNIIELEPANSVAKNREYMLQFALRNGYEAVVFADIDDYFSDNRVAHSLSLLAEYDIVVNDLTSFSGEKELAVCILSSRITDGDEINLDFIRDKNVFGLSNTALRLTDIDKGSINFPSSLVAVDWYLFSVLLCQSKRAVFTNKAMTYYRQHSSNTVGIGRVTKESLLHSLKVRENHYKQMLDVTDIYSAELKKNRQLAALLNNKEECEAVIEMNQTTNGSLLWWEVIVK
ncbi:family 2 glycosyl transferase [Vibrio sp. S9_S30]|uniref:NeuD/PglB/VioB family sugar acetyltransferase n=1 Tax=Vibrio sp. S9_S30 TaxID=2720226 RepID=UPI001680F06A|nr:NeuD/PglB/VioB family sugar acetyltransferase [Vibrio sp. S9_S30]MBD1558476.1 family 2 glycosyl transferase [Vibrio sp. S9_S30]